MTEYKHDSIQRAPRISATRTAPTQPAERINGDAMRGAGDILGFQAEEVIRAYEKALQKGEDSLAKAIRANHSDLEKRFAEVEKNLVIPSGI